MSRNFDPRVLSAELRAEYRDQAAIEAMMRMAQAVADCDHAAAFQWQQVLRLLLVPVREGSGRTKISIEEASEMADCVVSQFAEFLEEIASGRPLP